MKEPSVFAVLYYLCFSRDPLKCYAAHALTGKPDERNKSRALSALHRRMPPLERFKKQTVRQAGPCACWEEKGRVGFDCWQGTLALGSVNLIADQPNAPDVHHPVQRANSQSSNHTSDVYQCYQQAT